MYLTNASVVSTQCLKITKSISFDIYWKFESFRAQNDPNDNWHLSIY